MYSWAESSEVVYGEYWVDHLSRLPAFWLKVTLLSTNTCVCLSLILIFEWQALDLIRQQPHSFLYLKTSINALGHALPSFPSASVSTQLFPYVALHGMAYLLFLEICEYKFIPIWLFPCLCVLCMRASVHAKSLQLYPTPCNPMDCSQPGSSVHGALQAKILGWVIISYPTMCLTTPN